MKSYKSLAWSTVLLLPAYAEVVNHFTPHTFDNKTDIDLGVIDSVEVFFALVGTNESAWVELEAPKAETFDPDLDVDTFHPNSDNALMERQSDFVKYTMGALVAIYYAPRLIDRWALSVVILIKNGRTGWSHVQSGDIQARGLAGRAQELSSDADQVYFRVPAVLPSTLESRQVDEDGVEVEMSFYDEFSLDTATEQIYYRGVLASYSADDTNASLQRRELHERQQYLPIYNMLLRHHIAATTSRTTATPFCISQVL